MKTRAGIYLLSERVNQILQQNVVKVLASQQRISVRGFHFKNSFLNLQNGNIKRTSSQVIHSDPEIKKGVTFNTNSQPGGLNNGKENVIWYCEGNLQFVFCFVHSISQCGSCGFIDNTQNIETGNLSCIFRCLSLWIVEIRWDCYHCILQREQIMFQNVDV